MDENKNQTLKGVQTQVRNQTQSSAQTSTLRPSPDALLNPRLDPIFKSLFTQRSEDSQKALQAFLSAIFEKTVTNVEVDKNEIPIESEKDKQAIFDVTCRIDEENKILNIEMQGINSHNSFDNRSEYHVAHLLNHFVIRGMDWDDVPQTFMISVLNFTYDNTEEEPILAYEMRLKNGKKLKSARMNIIFIELPKIADLPDEPIEKLTHGQRWGKFFLYADRKDKIEYIKKLVQSEEGLMYAQNALSSISQSDAEWRRERDFIDAELTANTIRNQARKNGYKEGFSIGEKHGYAAGEKSGMQQGLQQELQQGLQQGMQQGMHSNKIENAKNLLQMKILTVEQIAQAVSLPIEEILTLQSESQIKSK